jgi:phenylpropionate dioxygenase-like ring-hydroxylating dioxygenase large terminal subunit
VPLVAVRGGDGKVRVFRNARRHRGTQIMSGWLRQVLRLPVPRLT